MTVEEYLDELMNGDAEDSRRPVVDPEAVIPATPEMSKILDEVELQWLEPKPEQITSAAQSLSKFDEKPSFWILMLVFISRSATIWGETQNSDKIAR